ncbi:MAG: CehA/McbA family metallohydrolase [Oceanococcaceae bacterium]
MRQLLFFFPLLWMTACQEAATVAAPRAVERPEGQWLKGDLHLHSAHSSDATAPLPELLLAAEAAGMDYFLLTDHDNHVNGDVASHSWADPAYTHPQMLMLYGAEWTTHRGHGNVIAAAPYDHASLYALRDAADVEIGRQVEALGVHLSANHPGNGDSFGFSYDIVRSIEVWNSAIWPNNSGAMTIWDDMLKSGRPLTGRGGSDAHHTLRDGLMAGEPNGLQELANFVGTPTTWVFARDRSAEAVVQALDLGRVAVSAHPQAERVELWADADGDGQMELQMGDITQAPGGVVQFEVRIHGSPLPLPLYTVRVVKNGAEFAQFPLSVDGLRFEDTPVAGERSYYRVELQGPPLPYPAAPGVGLLSAGMISLSNPIYFGFEDQRMR